MWRNGGLKADFMISSVLDYLITIHVQACLLCACYCAQSLGKMTSFSPPSNPGGSGGRC